MRLGLTYSVKTSSPLGHDPAGANPPAAAPDEEEEFDSPDTIAALAAALASLGHQVDLLGDGEPMLRKLLDGPRPDLVLNIAEGRGVSRSREARVPAVLEMLGIPYTGSDPLALAVTLDKDCAKRLVRAAGVDTPGWALLTDGDLEPLSRPLARLQWPLIVKPAYEGSSKGVRNASLVRTTADLRQAVDALSQAYRQPILIEEFIDGDELTVGMLGNRPTQVMGIMRVVPNQTEGPFLYSLEVKRDWRRLVRYECPARIPPAAAHAVHRAALAAWQALGCRDVGRLDFRLRGAVPYFLEANPLPGLAPDQGDLVLLAGMIGVEYQQLISRIIEAALDRQAATGAGAGLAAV